MSQPLNNDALPPVPELPPTWITWASLALAAVVVVAVVFGCLHAGRSFWHLACEHSSSLSLPRA
jgi:hypothetical protein